MALLSPTGPIFVAKRVQIVQIGHLIGQILDFSWTCLGWSTLTVSDMKTSLTTSLTIIGILATGGVALAANTTVLGPTLSSTQGLAPALAVAADSTVPVTVQSSYNVQGVGIITLGQNATALSVLAVDPITGWTYKTTNEQTDQVEIKFSTDAQTVKFTAELVDGRIVTEVQATDTSAALASKDDDEADDQSDDEADDQGDDESDDQGHDDGHDVDEDSNS